jgi:hypothetical protein
MARLMAEFETREGRQATRLYTRRAKSSTWRGLISLAIDAGLPVPLDYRQMVGRDPRIEEIRQLQQKREETWQRAVEA